VKSIHCLLEAESRLCSLPKVRPPIRSARSLFSAFDFDDFLAAAASSRRLVVLGFRPFTNDENFSWLSKLPCW